MCRAILRGVDVARSIALLQDSGDRLGRAAGAAGLDAAVPACPAWRVEDLLVHVAGIHRWAASYVRSGNEAPPTAEERAGMFPSVPSDEVLDRYRRGHADLVEALSAADPAMTCWTFLPAPSPLAFWARRQTHETAIHCVDAEQSAGLASAFPTDLAVDGIDELLNGFIVRSRSRLVADPPVSLGIRTVDDGAAWTVHILPDTRRVTAGVDDADCVVAGRAEDLYLLLWNRDPAGDVTVSGDARVMDRWRTHALVN